MDYGSSHISLEGLLDVLVKLVLESWRGGHRIPLLEQV